MTPITFGSVCSGIEAASVAFNPLGWRAAWFSEIDPYCNALLRHHYPHVPNWTDMQLLRHMIRAGLVPAPDVLCGGTPCQAFSVAGLRESLNDARGNLTLEFVKVADAIDAQRADPCVILWENVPGVLSTDDNAFGAFLGGLVGEEQSLVPSTRPPPGRSSQHWRWSKTRGDHACRWPDAGVVLGPRRAAAWRTLDAQFFGLAQRRRRVFVVASARKDLNPAAVLLEWEGGRRDRPPSRGQGQEATPGAGRVLAFGGNNTSGPIDVAAALNANRGCHNPGDFEAGTLLVEPGGRGRRMTPREYERAQGFPDDYTLVPGHPADGPRYKALGNSWAVPVVRWIGRRIASTINTVRLP